MENEKGCWCDGCRRRKDKKFLKRFDTTDGVKYLCWQCEYKLNLKTYGKVKK